jgi:hypothetical protein
VVDRGHTIRNLSWATQLSYIYAVAKFSLHFNPSPEGLDDCMHEMAPFKLRKGRTMRWARNLKVGGKRTIVHDVPGYTEKAVLLTRPAGCDLILAKTRKRSWSG